MTDKVPHRCLLVSSRLPSPVLSSSATWCSCALPVKHLVCRLAQCTTLYNSEMAPAKLRGALNILFQLMVTIGAHNPQQPVLTLSWCTLHTRHQRMASCPMCFTNRL